MRKDKLCYGKANPKESFGRRGVESVQAWDWQRNGSQESMAISRIMNSPTRLGSFLLCVRIGLWGRSRPLCAHSDGAVDQLWP